MVRFLLARPIAVIMSFTALLVFSLIVFRSLPVSLLPPIDVPQIVVKLNYPNASPEAIEQNALALLREGLITLNGLENLESRAGSETGTIRLTFDYSTPMNLAYIDVNEKIDRMTGSLPEDLPRPQVIRINTNDIPVVRVQVIPREGADQVEVTQLTENVLKKRIEQLDGVSLVDINGKTQRIISVAPNMAALSALGMSEENVISAIRSGNVELPGISVEDGQFRYYLRLATRVDNPADILQLPVRNAAGLAVSLEKVADVNYGVEESRGYHLYGEREGLVITVHKQETARMNDLLPQVYGAVEQFRKDYPGVDFELSQDQSLLLNAGISNLRTSLLFGGIFAFGVLFVFMGNYRMPLIIGISLPTSLLISFLVFYFLEISLNVISLSGLALGLGMLIDNAIIVLDNISRKRNEGLPLFEACTEGVNEVMSALVSSVLTTLAVFVPLIFLSGISGALFYDQAAAVAAILFVSLMVSFILLPLLYNMFFAQRKAGLDKEDSRFFLLVLKGYKQLYRILFGRRKTSLLLLLLLIPFFLLTGMLLVTEGLPTIEKFEAVAEVDWNRPIGVEQNRDRILALLGALEGGYLQAEADVGLSQFLLTGEGNSLQQATVYVRFSDQAEKDRQVDLLEQVIKENYPDASLNIRAAPNAFDQLFSSDIPYYEVRWREMETRKPVEEARMEEWLVKLPVREWERGPGLQKESSVVFRIDLEKLALYGVDALQLQERIQQLFGRFTVDEIKRFGEITPIRLLEGKGDFEEVLRGNYLRGRDNSHYSMLNFVRFNNDSHYRYVTADKGGIYQSIELTGEDPFRNDAGFLNWGRDKNLGIAFTGQYFKDRETISQLIGILGIAMLLLYFILAAQFESFVQPLIVILTLPLGIGGAFIVLFLTGTSLNVMSAIGLVVMLGILVNDAILKIDTINRLRIKYGRLPGQSEAQVLDWSLYEAGEIRLKPILMTSITTILALLPVVLSSGIGADLQRPLVFSVIGGLTVGTFTALYFVPLAYSLLEGKSGSRKQEAVT